MTARTVSIVAAGYRPRNEGHLPGRSVGRVSAFAEEAARLPTATTSSPFIAATARQVTCPALRAMSATQRTQRRLGASKRRSRIAGRFRSSVSGNLVKARRRGLSAGRGHAVERPVVDCEAHEEKTERGKCETAGHVDGIVLLRRQGRRDDQHGPDNGDDPP